MWFVLWEFGRGTSILGWVFKFYCYYLVIVRFDIFFCRFFRFLGIGLFVGFYEG